MTLGAAIVLDTLVKRFGSFRAVDGVSLRVEAGEFVTLLGSSGSGKTTTLMMIAGFILPDQGSIHIGDADISRLPPEKRGLGVVFQSYALFPHMDVYENVAFPLRLRGVRDAEIRKRVGDVLDIVDLGAFAQRRIAQLSGGQQQRVALARAIVFSPPVLLMDEPLGALDRKLRDQLQTEIKRIQRDLGVTVVYVTHDQEEALSLSDRIAIMSHGRIEQLGSPDDVYETPVSPFVASFLGESNFVPVRSVAVDGATSRVASRDGEAFSFGARSTPALAQGGPAIAMVRPEAFSIGPGDGERSENATDGKVLSREFMGATIRLLVDANIGRVVVRVPRLGNETSLAAGTPVSLRWKAQDTILFPADQA
jgi:spermidine/putrescine ABC transporter ATP-binding subunit